MATMVTRASAVQGDDAVIIKRSRQEPEHFAAIFDRYYAQIHGYAARRLGDSLADDVAAEAFLVAFERRNRYDVSCPNARPWLYGIASRLISGHHRSEERRYRALARLSDGEAGYEYADQVAQRVDAQAQRGPLLTALAGLGAGDRDVLLLVACAGLSPDEAGQALSIPAGTARSRLHRARKQIRAALGGDTESTWEKDHQK
jgi:RNA polymerase sigma-70 factor (ECF subfamily)